VAFSSRVEVRMATWRGGKAGRVGWGERGGGRLLGSLMRDAGRAVFSARANPTHQLVPQVDVLHVVVLVVVVDVLGVGDLRGRTVGSPLRQTSRGAADYGAGQVHKLRAIRDQRSTRCKQAHNW
jgi:hypothetical protein